MKKLILLILMCFTLVLSADARMSLMQLVGQVSMGGAVCSTSNDSLLFDSGYDTQEGASGDTWTAGKITISNQSDITEYILVLREQNHAGSINVSLYTDSGDKPNTEVIGTEVVVGHLAIDDDAYVATVVTLGTPKTGLTGAPTVYWLVVEEDGITINRANDNNGESGRYCYGANGTDWTCSDSIVFGDKVYGCE